MNDPTALWLIALNVAVCQVCCHAALLNRSALMRNLHSLSLTTPDKTEECQPLLSIYLTEVRYVGVCCRFECGNILGVGPGVAGNLPRNFNIIIRGLGGEYDCHPLRQTVLTWSRLTPALCFLARNTRHSRAARL